MFAPDIVISITFSCYEAGEELVRLRSIYLSSIAIELLLQDGQSKLSGSFWFDRDRLTLLTTDTTPYVFQLSYIGYSYTTVIQKLIKSLCCFII